jgi:hypothetical protein
MRTFGTCRLEHDELLLDVEPHVAQRLKRVFERVSKHPGTIHLAVTPENARELDWFLLRYPLVVTPEAAACIAAERDRCLEIEAIVQRLTDPSYVPTPVNLAVPPRPYQLLPAEMALALGGIAGVLCCDELGLGKTVEGILLAVHEQARPALVVADAGPMQVQWREFFARFAPSLDVHILKKERPYRDGAVPVDLAKRIAFGKPMPDVVITSWAKMPGWADWLAPRIRSTERKVRVVSRCQV